MKALLSGTGLRVRRRLEKGQPKTEWTQDRKKTKKEVLSDAQLSLPPEVGCVVEMIEERGIPGVSVALWLTPSTLLLTGILEPVVYSWSAEGL